MQSIKASGGGNTMQKAVVVGLGIGMAHAAGYLASKDARLHGVCDLIPQRTNHCGGTFEMNSMLCLKPLFTQEQLGKPWESLGVKIYSSLEAVLHDPQVDIVSLCTPDYLHTVHLKKAMASGKHILLEKPAAINISEADALSKKVNAYKGSIGIGYEFRLNPTIIKMKELVDSGAAGRIEGFSLYHFRTPFRRDKWHSWIQKKSLSGGLLIEETCHWFDLARYITGKEVGSLNCVTTGGVHSDFDFEDIAYINGTFINGGILHISHCLTGFDFALQLCVHGTEGTIWCGLKEEPYSSLDGGSSDHLGIISFGAPGTTPQNASVWKWGIEATEPENIKALAMDFAARAAAGKPQLARWDDGCESLRLSVKALESAETNKTVYINKKY